MNIHLGIHFGESERAEKSLKSGKCKAEEKKKVAHKVSKVSPSALRNLLKRITP